VIEDRRVFITGGAGFIGSATAEKLLKFNYVTIFDNLHRGQFNDRLANHPGMQFIQGDILDTNALASAIGGHDIIIHCAAIAGVDSVTRNPVLTMTTNMIGSANVLQASKENSEPEMVICLSTSEVFGPGAELVGEDSPTVIAPPGEPRWTYAAGKLAEEHLALAYLHQHQLPVAILRPFNIYGPGQVGEGAIRNFVLQAISGKDLVLHGTGEQVRSWCFIDDMVEAILLSISTPEAVGKSFNIGNANTVISIRELAELVVELSGSQSVILEGPANKAEILVRSPRVDLARDVLGFEATVDLNEGILRTIDRFTSDDRMIG